MPVTSGASWLRTFHPEWLALAGIDTVKVKFTYWQEIDTLFVDLSNGVPRRVNVPSNEDRSCFFLRVDVDIENIVKLQIEDFLGCAIATRFCSTGSTGRSCEASRGARSRKPIRGA